MHVILAHMRYSPDRSGKFVAKYNSEEMLLILKGQIQIFQDFLCRYFSESRAVLARYGADTGGRCDAGPGFASSKGAER